MDVASNDECSNGTSGDESSEAESNSHHGHGQRVSLGSLCMPSGARSTRRHSDAAMTTLVELPNVDGHPGEQIGPTGVGADSPCWFQAGFIPHNEQEVLTWHPNRLRATLAAELHRRVQHLTPRRSRTKTFEPLSALMNIFEKPGGDMYLQSAKDWKSATRGRDLYFRLLNMITGVPIRELRVTHGDRWVDTSKEDRAQWSVLHRVVEHPRIAPVIRFPHGGRKKPTRPETEEQSAEPVPADKVLEWTGYAFTLSYNTDLGTGDPDVIKLVQSGKTGESLYKGMRGMAIYSDAFADLWEHANKLARTKRFVTVNVSMEHSMNADWGGRVHFHVFVGPDLSSGIGFAWYPELKTVKCDEVMWRGKRPNVKASRPQKKSWNQIYQAAISGSYYVAGPKIGCIMKRSTHKPIEDMTMHICYEVPSSRFFFLSYVGGDAIPLSVVAFIIHPVGLSLIGSQCRHVPHDMILCRQGLPHRDTSHLESMEVTENDRRRLRT